MENTFVKAVTDKIKNKRDKTLIAAELESHILDKTDYYIELGYDKATAIKKATEDMGEPDDTALPLRALSGGAGRDWFYMLSIIYLAAAVIVPFFFHKFNYADSYYQAVYHLNIVDFVSMAIIFCYALILILAFKTKSKSITLLVVISLLLSNFNGMVIFRPAVYPLVKIFTSGIVEYIDSIFAYSYFTENLRAPLTIGSYIIFAVLLLWAAIQWTAIFMQEQLRNTKKHNSVLRIVKRISIILFSINLFVMTAGTAFAIVKLPEKREQLKQERKEIINYIINTPEESISSEALFADNSHSYGRMPPTLNTKSKKYKINSEFYLRNTYYGLVGNNAFINSDYGAAYTRTDFDLTFDVLDNYVVDSELLYNNKHDNLQVFIDEGWYDKAFMVYKYERYISFGFYTSENNAITVTFDCFYDTTDLSKYTFKGIYNYSNDNSDEII